MFRSSERIADNVPGHAGEPPDVESMAVDIDGLQIRSLRANDEGALRAAFDALSRTSRYQRFLGHTMLTEEMSRHLCRVDCSNHVALAAFTPREGRLVGVARFIRESVDRSRAEVAVTIGDGWQRRGLGTRLLLNLAEISRSVGVTTFVAYAFADNLGIRRLVAKAGVVSASIDGPEIMLVVRLEASLMRG